MTIEERGGCSVCVIIHESNFKSVACLYLMAASATHELLLELTSPKENDDPLADS